MRPNTIALLLLPCLGLSSISLGGCRFRQTQSGPVTIPDISAEFRQSYRPEAAVPDWRAIQSERISLIAALESGRFDDLDRLLGEALRAFEANPAAEERMYWLFEIFRRKAPSWEAAFKAWIAAKPGNPLALAAHAFHQECLGWSARGKRYSTKTSEAQFEGMRRHFAIAEAEALEALRLNPKLITAYIPLIGVARGGSTPRLQEYASRALAISPASYHTLFAHMMGLAPRWGGSHAAMDRFAKSAQAGTALNPELSILKGLSAWDRGRIHYENKRYDSARIEFQQAAEAGPFFDAHQYLGKTLRRLGRNEEALREFDRAIAARPLYAGPWVEKALTLLRVGRREEAERTFRRAAARDPWADEVLGYPSRAAEHFTALGYDAMEARDFPLAHRHLEAALRIDPANSEAYYYRAHVRIQEGDTARSLADAHEAVRLDPRSYDACKLMDDLLAPRGEWQRILAYWNAFLDLEPGHAEALFERSGTHFHAGNIVQARLDLKASCASGWQEACRTAKARFPQ